MAKKQSGPTEYKTFPSIALKADEDQGIVDHIITLFGVVDYGKDRSHPGSFKKTLAERGDKVRVLDMHQTDSVMRILGKPLSLHEIDRDELPAKVLKEYPEATGGLRATTQFFMDTPEGKGAFIRAKADTVEWSYGYDALDVDKSTVKVDGEEVEVRELKQVRLYEYGPVLFGMVPGTTTLSAKEGTGPSESKPAPEVTENTIRIRVRDPGDFEDDSFRTINIGGADSGIQATVGRLKGENTMTIQSYIFDKDKFTVEEAQAWVDEHKKDALPDLDEKQGFKQVTYNGVTCQVTSRCSSDRDDKKYARTVRYEDDERTVHYGDPDMPMRRNDPEARRNFLARHDCDSKQDPFAPGFWACYDWQNVEEKDVDGKQMTEDDGAGDLVSTENMLQCECVECGHKMDLPEGEHCSDLKCSECGGQMRRVGRPGPGKSEETEQVKLFGSVLNPYGTRSSAGYPGGRGAWKQAWRRMLSKGKIGTIMGTIRRSSMIAAGMKPVCDIPQGQSYEDVQPRSGACGALEGDWNHTPGDYGLSQWKDPDDDGLTREDIQLSCQDLKDIKLMCLQEIRKRHDCEDEGKSDCDYWLEIKDLDGEWLWEMSMVFGADNVVPPWEKAVDAELEAQDESPAPEPKAEVPEAVVFASVALQSVLVKLDAGDWEYKAAELAISKLRGLYGELSPELVAELETKAGRVLSARNAQRIGQALTSLIQVLEDAGIDVPGAGRELPVTDEVREGEEEEGKDYSLEIETLEAELDILETEGDTRIW